MPSCRPISDPNTERHWTCLTMGGQKSCTLLKQVIEAILEFPLILFSSSGLMPREQLWESHVFSMSTGIPCTMPYWNMVLLSARKHLLTSPQPHLIQTPLSGLTDRDLDNLILHFHSHYWHAGINMPNGMLWHLGHWLLHECIHGSLMRVDPMYHVFQRIQIRRRVYSVPGPMSLWHHDGQHGLCLLTLIDNF